MKHTSNSKAKSSPVSARLMPTEARGNYSPKPPYLHETKIYHSQPLESIRHAGNYFVPLSIQPIFIFCCRSYVKLPDYRRAEKFYFLLPEAPLRPEARGICHHCHMVNPALSPVVVVVVRVNCIDCKVQSTADVFEMMCRVSSRPLNPTRLHTWQRC